MKSFRQQVSKFRNIIIFLILVIFLLVFVIIANSSNQRKTIPDQAIATVEKKSVIRTVTTEGTLKGIDQRNVYLPSGTTVYENKVNLGDRVTKGQVLVTVKTQTGPRSVLTDLYAPIGGYVAVVNFKADDQIVAPGQPAFVIVDDSSYRIEVGINENDINEVSVGQKANISFPAISLDENYKAEVASVDNIPLQNTVGGVNYKVLLNPITMPAKYKVGMSTDVEITTAQADNVLAIPESFLIENGDKVTVKKITWKNAEKTDYELVETEVKVGLRSEEYVEIKSGLNAGDQIVEPSFTKERRVNFFGGN